jgi:hypothetical protein
MSPRPKKPPADPIEVPRTEDDLDRLMIAIEAHMGETHQLGQLFNEGKLDAAEVLDLAADIDEKLYNVLDTIQAERVKAMEELGRSPVSS